MSNMAEIENLKVEIEKINVRIAALQAAALVIEFPAARIELLPGEHYAGEILGEHGRPSYRLVLICGDTEDVTFEEAGAWAKEKGGELPDRREQSLLYANLKHLFKEAWYWSSEQRAGSPVYAWMQTFGSGGQSSSHKSGQYRAVAVRRLPI